MRYVGIKCESECNGSYKAKRYKKYFRYAKVFKGRIVRYFEVVEDTSLPIPVVNAGNIKAYDAFYRNKTLSYV